MRGQASSPSRGAQGAQEVAMAAKFFKLVKVPYRETEGDKALQASMKRLEEMVKGFDERRASLHELLKKAQARELSQPAMTKEEFLSRENDPALDETTRDLIGSTRRMLEGMK